MRGGDGESGGMTMREALRWLGRRAAVQRHDRTAANRNRWTLRDIEAVETINRVVRAAEAMGAGAREES